MHSCKENSDISLSKEFQRHLSKEHRKRGVVDQVKYRKRAIKRKLTDRKYHVQDNADIAHKYVKIYCDTNQFPTLTFCGPHPKPHGARGLSKNCHLCWHMCNFMHTMRLCLMYINARQTLDLWSNFKETSTPPNCHILYLLASFWLI